LKKSKIIQGYNVIFVLSNFHYVKKETIEACSEACFIEKSPPYFYAQRFGKQGTEALFNQVQRKE
jgi:hypothetical protein